MMWSKIVKYLAIFIIVISLILLFWMNSKIKSRVTKQNSTTRTIKVNK